METDKRIENMILKIRSKMNRAKNNTHDLNINYQCVKSMLDGNKNFGLTSKQIKTKNELIKAKQCPGSNYHQLLSQAAINHLKEQKAKGNILDSSSRLVLTEKYCSSGVSEIDEYVLSKCTHVHKF